MSEAELKQCKACEVEDNEHPPAGRGEKGEKKVRVGDVEPADGLFQIEVEHLQSYGCHAVLQ